MRSEEDLYSSIVWLSPPWVIGHTPLNLPYWSHLLSPGGSSSTQTDTKDLRANCMMLHKGCILYTVQCSSFGDYHFSLNMANTLKSNTDLDIMDINQQCAMEDPPGWSHRKIRVCQFLEATGSRLIWEVWPISPGKSYSIIGKVHKKQKSITCYTPFILFTLFFTIYSFYPVL